MTYGIRDIRERFGVGEGTVLAWIRNKELKAVNVSRTTGGRPKWRITQAALDEFEILRGTVAAPKPHRRRRSTAGDLY